MAYELDHLFERPMVACPHCGTRNEEGSETCLCCGKRLTALGSAVPADADTSPDSAPGADGQEPQGAPASVATETAVVSTAQPHGADGASALGDEESDEAVPHKRLPRWLLALIAMVNMLMICAVVLQVMYTKSPAHTVADYIEDQKFAAAQIYYNQNPGNNFLYRAALTRRLTALMDQLEARYKSGEISITTYTGRCRNTLQAALDTGLGDDFEQSVKAQLQQLLEETYAKYVRSVTSSSALNYGDVVKIFDAVVSRELAADPDRAQTLYTDIHLIFMDESFWSSAQKYEQNGAPESAIEFYANIAPDHPRTQAAVEGIDRCIAAWCANVRETLALQKPTTTVLQRDYSKTGYLLEKLSELNTLTPERENTLRTLQTEIFPHYGAALKEDALAFTHVLDMNSFQNLQYALEYNPGDKELTAALKTMALAVHRAGTLDNKTIVEMLNEALRCFPDDAELLAAAAPRKAQLKADLRKNLPGYLNSYDPMIITTEELESIMEIMPEDADVQALYRAMCDHFWYSLSPRWAAGNVRGFVYLFWESSDWKVTENLLINPIADAFRVLHQSAALYRMTATADAPSILNTGIPENAYFGTLKFSLFADPTCTGSGVMEIRTAHELDEKGQPVWSEPVWTSPVLDRNTNGVQVELNLNRAIAVDIRLTAENGTVVMLLDGAALKLAE